MFAASLLLSLLHFFSPTRPIAVICPDGYEYVDDYADLDGDGTLDGACVADSGAYVAP